MNEFSPTTSTEAASQPEPIPGLSFEQQAIDEQQGAAKQETVMEIPINSISADEKYLRENIILKFGPDASHTHLGTPEEKLADVQAAKATLAEIEVRFRGYRDSQAGVAYARQVDILRLFLAKARVILHEYEEFLTKPEQAPSQATTETKIDELRRNLSLIQRFQQFMRGYLTN